MADDVGTKDANENGGAKAPQDERAKWTPDQWADFTQREADRRVTEAQKKWRDDLTAQLTAKDRDAESKIQEALAKAEQAETRAAFVERAGTAGVVDVKAAWAVVQTEGDTFRDRRGGVDFDKLKAEHPSLFVSAAKQSIASHRADVGTGGKTDMNALLRGARIGG